MKRFLLCTAAIGALAAVVSNSLPSTAAVAQVVVSAAMSDECDLAGVIPDCHAVMAKRMAERALHPEARAEYHGFQPGEVDLAGCGQLCRDTALAAATAHCRNTDGGSLTNQVTKWQTTGATTFDGTGVERAAKLFAACLVSVRVARNGQVSVDSEVFLEPERPGRVARDDLSHAPPDDMASSRP